MSTMIKNNHKVAIENIYHLHKSTLLLLEKEPSLKSDIDSNLTKMLVISIASYYEEIIIKQILNYCKNVSRNDEKVVTLVKDKALSRQYHTLFDWNKINANRFFSYFGEEVKKKHILDIRECAVLQKSEKDFMTLGQLRNDMVHTNIALSPLDFTAEEIFEKYKSSLNFIHYIDDIFQYSE